MTATRTPSAQHFGERSSWHSPTTQAAATELGVELRQRLDAYGPNALPTEPPPSTWAVARPAAFRRPGRGDAARPGRRRRAGDLVVTIALSLITPGLVAADKATQLRRLKRGGAT